MDRVALRFRAVIWGCLFLLLCAAVPLLWGGSVAGWLVQSVPIALLLPTLHRHNRRSLQWLGFITLFILVLGILQVFTPDGRYQMLGLCNVIGSLSVFGLVVVTARQTRSSSSANSGVAP